MFSAVQSLIRPVVSREYNFGTRVERDARAILELQPALTKLSERAGQSGAMDDQRYFLSWLEARGKSPWLVTSSQEGNGKLDAAVLFYEHCVAGRGLRIMAAFDETGRRSLTSPRVDGTDFAMEACGQLLREGAQCILITFRGDQALDPARVAQLSQTGMSLRWASREKELADYLPLLDTLDDTLAPMGAKTRRNLRYYMRRVVSDLGAEFVTAPVLSVDEFLELNNSAAYRATEDMARWRYNSFATMKNPAFYGLRDGNGRWLSITGGLHAGDYMELYWQLNRDEAELRPYSISTATRAFMIEHEIKLGTRKLYMEGGTSHMMSTAFAYTKCTDLVIMRNNIAARAIPALVKKFVPRENPLYEFLEHPELEWQTI